MNKYSLYADGACSNNGKKDACAGWGFALYEGDMVNDTPLHEACGGIPNGTNNQGELTAIIEGLHHCNEALSANAEVVVYCDSSYCVKGITEWVHGWIRNGWSRSANKKLEVKNEALWRELYELAYHSRIRPKFQWVKGHADNKGNIIADELARKGVMKCD